MYEFTNLKRWKLVMGLVLTGEHGVKAGLPVKKVLAG